MSVTWQFSCYELLPRYCLRSWYRPRLSKTTSERAGRDIYILQFSFTLSYFKFTLCCDTLYKDNISSLKRERWKFTKGIAALVGLCKCNIARAVFSNQCFARISIVYILRFSVFVLFQVYYEVASENIAQRQMYKCISVDVCMHLFTRLCYVQLYLPSLFRNGMVRY